MNPPAEAQQQMHDAACSSVFLSLWLLMRLFFFVLLNFKLSHLSCRAGVLTLNDTAVSQVEKYTSDRITYL